jgi:hypothetical protein
MNRSSSLFSQIRSMVSRSTFEGLVAKHQSDRTSRGFRSWNQFVAMLFCQLAHS